MKYLIGNHKMNLSYAELEKYFAELKPIAEASDNFVGVCVPYVYLPLASTMCKGTKIHFGVQNMYYAEKGAYTGEISANMLKDFDTQMVILGHSERRSIFKETDEMVNLKVHKTIEAGFTPILCIGETKEERETNQTNDVLKTQLVGGLKDVSKDDLGKILFAYEPVWAIGTGISATKEDAEETIKYVKEVIAQMYGIEDLAQIVVLYGGSLKGDNVDEILSQPHIDGGLIGGASLKVEDFNKLIAYKG
ncbi:MAG: triose-phosphate isomerase [Clostridia bacterium]|nr:triose-phosphate isomerase [Clostridia bacterium]